MVYISWSFLKMGDKADGKTGLVLLLISLIPLALVTFFAFILGVGMLLYAWPVLLPMLLPFYLPFALRKEAVREIHSRNILFGRDPLAVTYRTVVRNWVYAVYAVLPALPLPFLGWKMPLDGSGNGRGLAEFFLFWTALYASFLLLTVVLGKTGCLQPMRLLLAACANLALVLLYSLCC